MPFWFVSKYMVKIWYDMNENRSSYLIPKAACTSQKVTPGTLYPLRPIGVEGRVFRETGDQSQVESFQRLKKWYLIRPCLTLSMMRYYQGYSGAIQGKLLKKEPQVALDIWSPNLLTLKDAEGTPGKQLPTPTTPMTAILANTPDQAETLQHSLERAAAGIGLHVNPHKTEYMCFNQTGDISTIDRCSLKLVDKFIFLGSSVSSTEKDISTQLTKVWTAVDRLSIIWKSDLTDKTKGSFFQAAIESILLYGCTTWTLTKRLEKKIDGNYTKMLRAILNKTWGKHPTKHQLYGHSPPITKTIQVRRTRHAGHCWRSRDEFISDVLLWTPWYGRTKAWRPARTHIQQLCEDTEDLPEAMNDREEWWERVRDIRDSGTRWWGGWWWYIYIYIYNLVAKTNKNIQLRNYVIYMWKYTHTHTHKYTYRYTHNKHTCAHTHTYTHVHSNMLEHTQTDIYIYIYI